MRKNQHREKAHICLHGESPLRGRKKWREVDSRSEDGTLLAWGKEGVVWHRI